MSNVKRIVCLAHRGTVYTIGHSNHSLAAFLALLRNAGVTAVADVRSAPYSRFNPQFNREALGNVLRREGLDYIYIGHELGGRSDDPRCYERGRICYDRVARTARFKAGVARLLRDAGKQSMALMCAEKEPLDCHRALLVAPALADHGLDIAHIHASGVLEPHGEAMHRLLAKFNLLQQEDLFAQPGAALIDAAIKQQTARVGYVERKFT